MECAPAFGIMSTSRQVIVRHAETRSVFIGPLTVPEAFTWLRASAISNWEVVDAVTGMRLSTWTMATEA
jgi:hypothetical protein